MLTLKEKTKIMMEALEEYIQLDYSFESVYEKALQKGLNKISKEDIKEYNGK